MKVNLNFLLLLSVLSSFSFSSWAQCDEKYELRINDTYNYSSSFYTPPRITERLVCKDSQTSFKVLGPTNDQTTYRFLKNDSLLSEGKENQYNISGSGSFLVEVVSGNCLYKIGHFNIEETEIINVTTREDTIHLCESSEIYEYIYGNTNVNFASSEIEYTWTKNGFPVASNYGSDINPESEGIYQLKASIASCIGLSKPVVVIKENGYSVNNELEFYFDKQVSIEGKDTVLICAENSYKLYSSTRTDWYKDNEKVLSNSKTFEILESGLYSSKKVYSDYCTYVQKPKYFFQSSRIEAPMAVVSYQPCKITTVSIENLDTDNAKNKLDIYDESDGRLIYSSENVANYDRYGITVPKIRLEYSDENCSSASTVYNLTPNKSKMGINGRTTEGSYTELALCENQTVEVSFNEGRLLKTTLYRNGLPYLSHPPGGRLQLRITLTEEGIYNFVSESNECLNYSDTLSLIKPSLESIGIEIRSQDCEVFRLSPEVTSGNSFNWVKNGELIDNGISINELEVSISDTNSYNILVKNLGCISYSEQIVPERIGKVIGTTNLFVGDELSLSTSNPDEINYTWTTPKSEEIDGSELLIKSISKKEEGEYFLETNFGSCSITDTANVTVEDGPKVKLTFLSSICEGEEVYIFLEGERPSNGFKIEHNFKGQISSLYYPTSYYGVLSEIINLGVHYRNFSENPYLKIILWGEEGEEDEEYLLFEGSGVSSVIGCNNSLISVDKTNFCSYEETVFNLKFPAQIEKDTKFNIYTQVGRFAKKLIGSVKASDSFFKYDLPDLTEYVIIQSEDESLTRVSPKLTIIDSYLEVRSETGEYAHCSGFFTPLRAYSSIGDFLWKKDGELIDGLEKGLIRTEAWDEGAYSIIGENQGCIFESKKVTVKRDSIPKPSINTGFKNHFFCKGTEVSLASTSRFNYTSVQWKRNNLPLEGGDSTVLKVSENGNYTIEAKQGSCSAYSDDTINIQFGDSQVLPEIAVVYGNGILNNGKYYICEANEFRFNEYALSSLIKNQLSFQWQRNGKDVPGAITSYLSSVESGRYRLKVSGGTCVNYSNEIEVVNTNNLVTDYTLLGYNEALALSEDDVVQLCAGSSVGLARYIGPESFYGWTRELYLDGVLQKMTYPDGENKQEIDEPGNYQVKFVNPNQATCILSSKKFSVEFIQNDTLALDRFTFYGQKCSTGRLLYATNGSSYNWIYQNELVGIEETLETSNLGIYEVYIEKENGCVLKKEYEISDKPISNIHVYPSSRILCDNSSWIRLFVSYSYKNMRWFKDDSLIQVGGLDILVNEPGFYHLEYTTAENCRLESQPVEIMASSINNRLSPDMDILNICPNGGFQTLETVSESDYNYHWYFNDELMEGEDLNSIKAENVGVYYALISKERCVYRTPEKHIYAITNELPTATISGDSLVEFGGLAELSINFTSSPPFSYTFTNGEVGESNTLFSTHSFSTYENTTFELASVVNTCGEGQVFGTANIQVLILGDEPDFGSDILVYPNPISTACNLKFALKKHQNVSYSLLDISGKIYESQNLGRLRNSEIQLNLDYLKSGTYLLVFDVDNKKLVRKVIKN